MAIQFNPIAPDARIPIIQGYRDGGFRVSGQLFAGGVLVLPDGPQAWTPDRLAALSLQDVAPAIAQADRLELLLLGTGRAMARPPALVLDALRDAGLACDFMDSRAAARTYNLVVGEGRSAAAALLPLD